MLQWYNTEETAVLAPVEKLILRNKSIWSSAVLHSRTKMTPQVLWKQIRYLRLDNKCVHLSEKHCYRKLDKWIVQGTKFQKEETWVVTDCTPHASLCYAFSSQGGRRRVFPNSCEGSVAEEGIRLGTKIYAE